MNTIPVYNAELKENQGDGLYAISLVSSPAVERDFVAFDKDKKPEFKFEVENKLMHCITGVVMLADTPIYRYSPDMGEYYIKFSKDTIRQMAMQMLKWGSHNTIDIEHNEDYFYDKMNLVECYIKDSTKGINHTSFTDIPDGSLICTYKVIDVDLWDKIESGEVKGFSLEAWLSISDENFSKVEDDDETKELLELINKLGDKLKK